MKHQSAFRPRSTLAALIAAGSIGAAAAAPADLPAPLPSPATVTAADGPSLETLTPSIGLPESGIGSVAGALRSTFTGTAMVAGSISQLVADTVRSTVDGTATVAGGVTHAVGNTFRNTVAGTASVAGLLGNALSDTVKSTMVESVGVAGTIGNVVADTLASTVSGTVSAAGTVGEGVRSLVAAPKRMLAYAESLIGTPYRWGGTSVVNGLDCSGFVQEVVKTATGKLLPRTAREMSAAGRKVSYNDLKPGDLVFFNTRRRPYSHVGIYLGDGEFVHGASGVRSGRQVRIDKLDNNYYRTRYNGARRIDLPADAYSEGNQDFDSLLAKVNSRSFAPR